MRCFQGFLVIANGHEDIFQCMPFVVGIFPSAVASNTEDIAHAGNSSRVVLVGSKSAKPSPINSSVSVVFIKFHLLASAYEARQGGGNESETGDSLQWHDYTFSLGVKVNDRRMLRFTQIVGAIARLVLRSCSVAAHHEALSRLRPGFKSRHEHLYCQVLFSC